ncbi:hypothetical protein HDU78_002856 [Chytriomyces hyalinus]|nr:hypothetical protein HDU78_002856 [Chytriomyces hyalinus]
MKIKNCALGKLKKGEFSIIQFVKYMKWTFTEKDPAKRTLKALYELAAETRKGMSNGEANQNIKESMIEMHTIYVSFFLFGPNADILLKDHSPLSKWNSYWQEKESCEGELAESKLKKHKMVSLMMTEVIKAVDKHQAKVLKRQSHPNPSLKSAAFI